MRFEVAVHFVANSGGYRGQIIVRRVTPEASPIDTVTLTLRSEHAEPGAALELAHDYAELLRRDPQRCRALFDLPFM
jgi:hypothetical protein